MEVTVKIDPQLIEDAARALDVFEAGQSPGRLLALALRTVAGTRRRSSVADGGAAPKRAGRNMETQVVTHANERGMNWDRAPLRGRRDLLDVTGCLPDGWLVGTKGVTRGVSAGTKLADAMDQARRAMDNLPGAPAGIVVPWQVIQRPGAPVGRYYAVTEFDWMLDICQMRREWKDNAD